MLKRLAMESGIATPTADDLIRLHRRRKGKRPPNADSASPSDSEAKIAKLKMATPVWPTSPSTRSTWLAAPSSPPNPSCRPRRYHHLAGHAGGRRSQPRHRRRRPDAGGPGRARRRQRLPLARWLKDLEDSAWKSRVAEKRMRDIHRWHGDEEARRAVYNNRARLRSGGGQGGLQASGRAGPAQLCPHPPSCWHAPCVAAWPREPAQALPRPRLRLQSRPDHAAPGRRRHSAVAHGPRRGSSAGPHHRRGHCHRHPRRRKRHRNSATRRQHRAGVARLTADFLNGLLTSWSSASGSRRCCRRRHPRSPERAATRRRGCAPRGRRPRRWRAG